MAYNFYLTFFIKSLHTIVLHRTYFISSMVNMTRYFKMCSLEHRK